jgi:hypothetical protein
MSANLYEAIVALRDSIPGSYINEGPNGGPEAGALFTEGGTHRLLIWRQWQTRVKYVAAWVKHNPSKASGDRSDPTFTSAVDRAHRWGLNGVLMANLGSYVATDPKDFAKAPDPIGKHNPAVLAFVLEHAAQVFVGWGNFPTGPVRHTMVDAAARFAGQAKQRGVPLWCLGINENGSPKHLLSRGKGRIPKDANPERWR